MRQIVPLADLGRTPEQGRIRLGVKTERAMKSLDTFRFTSPDQSAIEQISALYGGIVGRWTAPRSKQPQWEVITEASEIKVYLPPHSIDVWYEAWSSGGCQRRCDGVTAEVPMKSPDGMDIDTVPCPCDQEKTPMQCAPYTRLRVILPDVKFGGIWRLESKGWNAANELPGMASVLEQLQSTGLAQCQLVLEQRTKVSGGQTKHFVVPRLSMDASPDQLLEGEGRATTLHNARTPPRALPPVEIPEAVRGVDTVLTEAEIIDASIVEGTELWDPEAEEVKGWDKPPPGVKVKKNPDPPPKFIPA